jgi:hypothetical protein
MEFARPARRSGLARGICVLGQADCATFPCRRAATKSMTNNPGG